MLRLPFLRPKSTPAEYAKLASDALAQVVPVSELLRSRGVSLGQLQAGRAYLEEGEAVAAHLDELAPIYKLVSRVRPPPGLQASHRTLRNVLRSYNDTLRSYQAAGAAIAEADAEAYRSHNAEGREADAHTCEALGRLIDAADASSSEMDIPETLRRIAAKAEAYRRVAGGAFAFWE